MKSLIWLLALIFFSFPGASLAEDASQQSKDDLDSDSDAVSLSEVVVSETAEEKTPPSIDRHSRQEIENSGAVDFTQILETRPSIQTNTGSKGERSFLLRGFTQRQIGVMIDGTPAYVPYEGKADLSMLPAEMIENVTVIKGAGTVLAGPNGLGGVVNIVTRQPGQGPLFTARFEQSNLDTFSNSVYHGLRKGVWSHALSLGLYSSEGFRLPGGFEPTRNEDGGLRNNSDRKIYHAVASGSLELPQKQKLQMQFSFAGGEKGVPPALTEYQPRYWRFNDWRTFGATLGHSIKLDKGFKIDEALYFRQYYDVLDSYDDATYTSQNSYAAFHSTNDDRSLGGRVRLTKWFRETGMGDVALRGWISAQHDWHFKTPDSDADTTTYERTIFTFAPEAEWQLNEAWAFLAAIQVDAEIPDDPPNAEVDDQFAWGPLVKITYQPFSIWTISASGARRTRFPTLKERFSGIQGRGIPNPGLLPEVAWHANLDSSLRPLDWLQWNLSGFDAEVSDLIEPKRLENGKEQIQNIGQARLAGVETGLTLNPSHWVDFEVAYQFLHAEQVDSDDGEDKLEYRPAHTLTTKIATEPTKWLRVQTSLRFVGAQYFIHPDTLNWGELGNYLVWNARMEFAPLDFFAAWIRASNLLDSNYQTQFDFPEPGRTIWLGIKLTAN